MLPLQEVDKSTLHTYLYSAEVNKNELKPNSEKIPSDLVDEQHGHLRLVITLAEYTAISSTPYNCSQHSGPASLLGAKQWETTMLQETCCKDLGLHCETQMVE